MAGAPLFSAQNLKKQFGIKPLFEGISLSLSEGERVALIGPNGSGKSTLLKILAGAEVPDEGALRSRSGLKASYVPQSETFDETLSVGDTLRRALVDAHVPDTEIEARVSLNLGKAGFADADARVSTLSGGWRKHLAIVRGIATDPELLLLDEPTNHLDIQSVLWLEDLLGKFRGALLFVSHDRYFIERLAERVVEIDRRYPQGFFGCRGKYSDFLEKREEYWESLKRERQALAGTVRREVEWLRQGAKARTTKSKHRTEEAGKLIEKLKGINLNERRVDLEFAATKRQTKDLIRVENISKTFGEKTLFKNVTLTLSPGVCLGVVGSNGSGKTTFMKVLLGELPPDMGTVVRASNLRASFFDQARRQLDPTKTLKEALCIQGGDSVVFQGSSLHVASWAARFLFSSSQLGVPVGGLSGGEQARVLLARIMLGKADVLFFDEPTNDLDIATLEVLEQSFSEFPGAIVLVTHDRYLLDRSATTVLAIEGDATEIYSDYFQWEAVQSARVSSEKEEASPKKLALKLSYAEQKELNKIESQISSAEAKLEQIQLEMSAPAVTTDAARFQDYCAKLQEQQARVEHLYARWEELERKKT